MASEPDALCIFLRVFPSCRVVPIRRSAHLPCFMHLSVVDFMFPSHANMCEESPPTGLRGHGAWLKSEKCAPVTALPADHVCSLLHPCIKHSCEVVSWSCACAFSGRRLRGANNIIPTCEKPIMLPPSEPSLSSRRRLSERDHSGTVTCTESAPPHSPVETSGFGCAPAG